MNTTETIVSASGRSQGGCLPKLEANLCHEGCARDGAVDSIREFSAFFDAVTAVGQLAELGVADALSEAPESAEVLASRVDANADALRRVLRFVSTYGVFVEEADGRYRHSPLSRVLRADHPQSQRAWFRFAVTPITMAVTTAFGHALRTGRPAAEALAGQDMFSYFSAHPEEASIFDQAMAAKSHGAIAGVLKHYDFSPFRTIADIGGGRGHLLRAVLDATPTAKGVLFDLPHAISAIGTLASERLALKAGDFFRDVLPAADAYLLMNVVHGWADDESIDILRAVRRSASPHARLLLLEANLPSGGERSLIKYYDLLMLKWTNGRERTTAQYRELLITAGFELRRVIPASPEISIFEAGVAS